MINALKLLANQQEDGYGLLQNIVKNLGKESRKRSHGRLREFIKVDNERALGGWIATPRHGNIESSVAESCGRGLGCDSQGEPG